MIQQHCCKQEGIRQGDGGMLGMFADMHDLGHMRIADDGPDTIVWTGGGLVGEVSQLSPDDIRHDHCTDIVFRISR